MSLRHKTILVTPFIASLLLNGLLLYAFPSYVTRLANIFWLYIVVFALAYLGTDFLISKFTRSEKHQRRSFVYGLIVGGIITYAIELFATELVNPPGGSSSRYFSFRF